MNGGFSFDSANHVFRVFSGFMGKSLVIAVRSSTKSNNTTKFAHVHEQSEFTYGVHLVAAEHL